MKKLSLTKITAYIFLCLATVGCTENERTKAWGGTSTIHLDKDTKLINVSWKEGGMWILTRRMTEFDRAERFEFSERSNFGILQGKVIFIESK